MQISHNPAAAGKPRPAQQRRAASRHTNPPQDLAWVFGRERGVGCTDPLLQVQQRICEAAACREDSVEQAVADERAAQSLHSGSEPGR